MEHEMVLVFELRSNLWMRCQDCVRGGTISARARGGEAFEWRQFVHRTVREQPRGDFGVARELGNRVRSGAVAAPA